MADVGRVMTSCHKGVKRGLTAVGCLMSSTSMALAGHGIDVGGKGANPGSLNAWLRAHNGYTPTNDFEESALDSVSSLLSPGAVRWPKDGMHTKVN